MNARSSAIGVLGIERALWPRRLIAHCLERPRREGRVSLETGDVDGGVGRVRHHQLQSAVAWIEPRIFMAKMQALRSAAASARYGGVARKPMRSPAIAVAFDHG